MPYLGESANPSGMVWTNEANWATDMAPQFMEFHTWDQIGVSSPWQTSVPSEGKPVVHAAKYLDVRLSEMHGIPIYTPLYSGARRNVVPAGYVHGQFRDQLFQSPGNSSQVLPAGSARPGGTKGSYHLEGLGLTRRQFDRIEKGAFNPCVEGYVPRKVRGKWMCVPKSSKKSRSR